MNRRFYQLLSAFFLLTLLAACQKEINSLEEEETEQPEEIRQHLPKQIVLKDYADNYTEVWSMQYDTTNRRINVFFDDTTTANPYDALKASYQFNEAGYLVKFIGNNGFGQDTSIISRDANNRINYITNLDEFFESVDTNFYSYVNNGAESKVTIERRSYFDQSIGMETNTYIYANNILKTMRPSINAFDVVYQYEQSKLTNIGWSGNGDFFSMVMTYQSSSSAEPRDLFLELILGKDHYVQDIRDLYFFFVFKDRRYVTLSATDPHRINSFSFTYKNENEEGSDRTDCSYEFNEKGQPVSIFMQSELYTAQYLIRY